MLTCGNRGYSPPDPNVAGTEEQHSRGSGGTPMRSAKDVAARAQAEREKTTRVRVTFKKDVIWSADEDALCREFYPDYRKLEKLLPHRTRCAIEFHCTRALKLFERYWTEERDRKFKKLWTTGSCAEIRLAFPGKSAECFEHRARWLGVRRPRRQLKITGHPIVDRIRALCSEIRWSRRDLDEACGTTYFCRATAPYKPNQAAVKKALKIFEGYL